MSTTIVEPGAPDLTTPQPAPTAAAAPAPEFNRTAADDLFDACLADAKKNTARLERDRQDWLNLLMYRGGPDNQWVVYDRGLGTYVTRGDDPNQGGLPAWIPRAATNVLAKKIDGIQAILDQSAPDFQFAPSTDDDEDRAAADVAETAAPTLLEEILWDELRPRIHQRIMKIDKVAVVVYYDADPRHGTQPIQLLQCVNPQCGELITPIDAEASDNRCAVCDGDLADAFDPTTLQPVGMDYPVGKICAELIPSFEFSLPTSARVADARLVPWVLTHSRMAKEDALRLWGNVPGARDAIEGGGRQPGSSGVYRAYGDALPKLASPHAAQMRTHAGMGGANDGPIVYRLYHDPTDDLPGGAFMVRIGDTTVEAGPLPFTDHDGRPFKNVAIRSYAPAPGTAFGKPPSDDMTPLQELRNTIETLITCILLREAAPRTYVPVDVSLEDDITGTPGEQIRYRSLIPGSKPETERGVNPPEGLYRFLEMIDQKFEELSGLNSVLSGARPEGDPTLGEVEILQERGMSSFKSPLDTLISFERQLLRMLIAVARQSAWSPRFRKTRGENGQWELSQFVGADLTGRIDITVDPQTAWPKSPIMQSLRLDKALERGILPPPINDPELQSKVLLLYGLSELKPSIDVDRKQVSRILDRWKSARDPREIAPVNPIVDNLPLHLYLKTLFLKTEEAEKLRDGDPETQMPPNPGLYQAMVTHVQTIGMMLAQQQAQAAGAGAGQPAGGPGEREQNDGSALNAAVESGVLQPKGAQGDPMQAALDAGALVPAGAMAAPQGPSIDDLIAAGAMLPLPPQMPSSGPGVPRS